MGDSGANAGRHWAKIYQLDEADQQRLLWESSETQPAA